MFKHRRLLAIIIGVLLAVGLLLLATANARADSMSYPQPVGTLPDGRVVQHVTIQRGMLQQDHHIYYVDRADVTTNYSLGDKSSTPVTTSALAELARIINEQNQRDDRNFNK